MLCKTLYSTWSGMLHRCYSDNNREARYRDRGTEVCAEWYNFQNFYKWAVKVHKEGFHLDKDILSQGNKIYSPDTCCFVPLAVNSLLTYTQSRRGGLPCGMSYNPDRGGKLGNYSAQVCDGSKKIIWLGYFGSPEDAFLAYKEAKECIILKVAKMNLETGNITVDVYDALLRHEVLPYPE